MNILPNAGLLRLYQIIGRPKANPPIPGLIPVSRVTWWRGIQEKRFPEPVYIDGVDVPFWTAERIRAVIESAAPAPQGRKKTPGQKVAA